MLRGSSVKQALAIKAGAETASRWVDLPMKERIERASTWVPTQNPVDKQSKKMKDALADIVNLCRRNNIRIVGIEYPMTSEYNDVLDRMKYLPNLYLEKEGIPVIKAQRLFMDHDDYFEDVDHLDPAGAKAFVKALVDKLGLQPVSGAGSTLLLQ
jgi:hypothetical protein